MSFKVLAQLSNSQKRVVSQVLGHRTTPCFDGPEMWMVSRSFALHLYDKKQSRLFSCVMDCAFYSWCSLTQSTVSCLFKWDSLLYVVASSNRCTLNLQWSSFEVPFQNPVMRCFVVPDISLLSHGVQFKNLICIALLCAFWWLFAVVSEYEVCFNVDRNATCSTDL